MTNLKETISFLNDLIVPREGKNDGISLLWIREMDVEIKSFARSYIDVIITYQSLDLKSRLTGFYGNPDTNLRRESWNLLKI